MRRTDVRWIRLAAAFLLVLLPGEAARAGGPQIERALLFSGTGDADWVGRGRLVEHGPTWIFVYVQSGQHGFDKSQIMHVRFSTDEGSTWTEADTLPDGTPVRGAPLVSHDDDCEVAEGVLVVCPNGDLLLHAMERTPEISRGTYQYRSADGGRSWRDEGKVLGKDTLRVALGHTIVGEAIYLPMLESARADTRRVGPLDVDLYRSVDGGKTWRLVGRIAAGDEGVNETGIAHLGGRTLVAVHRTNAEDRTRLRRSDDLGRTWGPLVDLGPGVGAVQQPQLKRFADEPHRLYLFGRERIEEYVQRNALWYSDDQGKSWTKIPLDERALVDTGYGDALKRTDGALCYLAYRGTDDRAEMFRYVLRPAGAPGR